MSQFRVRLTQGDRRSGGGNLDTQAQKVGSITGATNASPIVVTSTAHGLVSGAKIAITGVLGNTAANGTWQIVVADANNFKLYTYQKSFLEPSQTTMPSIGVAGALVASSGNSAYVSGGTWATLSIQRTMDVPGPGKRRRILHDGELFTDCNYWKRFTYPTLAYNDAFIEVVSDDGSPYIDGETSGFGQVYNLTINAGSTYSTAGNSIDVLGLFGSYAKFVQITVAGDEVNCRLNGSDSAVLIIQPNTTQIFNSGDLPISKIEFDNSESGATLATVSVVLSVAAVCNS